MGLNPKVLVLLFISDFIILVQWQQSTLESCVREAELWWSGAVDSFVGDRGPQAAVEPIQSTDGCSSIPRLCVCV